MTNQNQKTHRVVAIGMVDYQKTDGTLAHAVPGEVFNIKAEAYEDAKKFGIIADADGNREPTGTPIEPKGPEVKAVETGPNDHVDPPADPTALSAWQDYLAEGGDADKFHPFTQSDEGSRFYQEWIDGGGAEDQRAFIADLKEQANAAAGGSAGGDDGGAGGSGDGAGAGAGDGTGGAGEGNGKGNGKGGGILQRLTGGGGAG